MAIIGLQIGSGKRSRVREKSGNFDMDKEWQPCNRQQSVITNGINSSTIPVSSGVAQGSVLIPILFLAYIIDLPEQVRSRV